MDVIFPKLTKELPSGWENCGPFVTLGNPVFTRSSKTEAWSEVIVASRDETV